MLKQPRKALIALLVYMAMGPIITFLLIGLGDILLPLDAPAANPDTIAARFQKFINGPVESYPSLAYAAFLPFMTILGIIVALRAMQNKGVSLRFSIAGALCLWLALAIFGILFAPDGKDYISPTMLVDLFVWIVTSAVCWNFLRLFHAHTPASALTQPHQSGDA